MKVTNTSQVASSRVAALIVGPSGIGKTFLAKTLNPKETLIISAESGLLCLAGTDIDVAEVSSLDELTKVIDYLKKKDNKYKNIFVDSLTEIAELILKVCKEEFPDASKSFPMWGRYAEMMAYYTKAFRDLNDYSVFVTCLDSQKTDGLERITTFNLPGQKIKDDIKSYFDLVLSYKIYPDEQGVHHRKLVTDMGEAPLAKDRSGKLDKYEDPNLGNIINKLIGGK